MCMCFFLQVSFFPIKKIDEPFWHPCLWDWVGLTRLRHHTYGGKEIGRKRNLIVGYFRDQVGIKVFKVCEQRGLYARPRTLGRRHNLENARKSPQGGIIILSSSLFWKWHNSLNKEDLFDDAILEKEDISSYCGGLGTYVSSGRMKYLLKSYWV